MRRYAVRVSHPVYSSSCVLLVLDDPEVAVEFFTCDENGDTKERIGVASVALIDGKLVAAA